MHKNTAVNEFINKVIGTKWVDRACTFNEMDCWGAGGSLLSTCFKNPTKNNYRLSIIENDNSKLSHPRIT
ncbi:MULTISPECIES: hypothetical protein [unclassified Gilliamella]|uniref:hypothetical protein n=1 Tax=unclassified Gilliamella TaxID=2685620 RepID=UPI00226AEDC0|nr:MULTISPECIES: hypothetical protein [unclassified Gilliamella]MCX8610727.1 hypothetical protein [Gilliamella sp. B3891]MCX8601303.1 hypothetical protein [Gilliamella sp. B3722]MCX8607701.1 hypothetical protein [Gilliamella sp. B3771]MCX8613034.1 hypothetical protein [Gilliamella sp. B3773]MCX8615468.1 hypothetical protein [Gilliamella sp. B3770]